MFVVKRKHRSGHPLRRKEGDITEQGKDKIIDLDKLHDLIDDKDNRKCNPFHTKEIDEKFKTFWKQADTIIETAGIEIDKRNELYDSFCDHYTEVQNNAFKIGYRTAVDLILKHQGE